MKSKELIDREVKIKREIEDVFCKAIAAYIDDTDKFEEQETKKVRPIKNTWENIEET